MRIEHSDGQPGNFELYRSYHEAPATRPLPLHCVSRPTQSVLTVVNERMRKAADLPTLRWHGGGDHRGTEQAKLAIYEIF